MPPLKIKPPSYYIAHYRKRLTDAAIGMAIEHGQVVLADLFHAIRTQRSAQIMVGLLAACIIFWNVPLVSLALYPFKLFVTMIHESCHALAALLTGGTVASLSIAENESGLTETIGGFRPVVSSAGYMGTSSFGGAMICIGRKPDSARTVLYVLGWILFAITMFFGSGGAFSIFSMGLISLGILLVAKKANTQTCHIFLLMLAVICTIEAFIDFQTLMMVAVRPDVPTDAANMARHTHIPRTFWTLFFGFFSMTVLFLSFWLSYRPTKKVAESA